MFKQIYFWFCGGLTNIRCPSCGRRVEYKSFGRKISCMSWFCSFQRGDRLPSSWVDIFDVELCTPGSKIDYEKYYSKYYSSILCTPGSKIDYEKYYSLITEKQWGMPKPTK